MPCPTCQGPLDPATGTCLACASAGRAATDNSLACASAGQAWCCGSCGRLSTGFAFAYRSCPHCGGALALQGDDPPDPAAEWEGVRAAFEIELGGRAFYQRAAADSTDAAMKQLFGRFALMEGEHMEALSRRYGLDVPPPSPAFRMEVAAIFANVPHRPQDPENLLRIAIGLEKRAAQFFDARARLAPEGSAQRQLYGELAQEEREHAELLLREQQSWRAGRPGLIGGRGASGAAAAAGQSSPLASHNAAWLLLAGQDATRTALVCGSASISVGALREAVARTAGYWRSRGIQPGDRIAIKLCDGIAWVSAFLGAMWAGAVAVPVNPKVPMAEWHYILDEAGFSLILADSSEDTPSPWRERTLTPDELHRGQQAALSVDAWPVDPQEPAFWCHSSGTSGKPKAVVHAHRFAQHIEQVSRDGVGITATDRLFASSRLFFSYPQTNSLWAGLKLGATVILDPQWPTAASVAATVAAQRPTVLLSVPSLYRNLLHEGLAPGIAQAGVRLCLSAGEALPPSLRQEWQRQTGINIVNGYGASESLVLVMLDRGDGQGFSPAPGVEIQAMEPVPPGQPSRLRIVVPTLALGYLDRPQAQAETFRDGAFCPADLFARDEHGGWRFAGREDSLVKIHGRWVNLVELEERLSGQTLGIREGAAVLVPDADGVDAVAFFYVAADRAAACTALQQRAGALPPYQRPRWWHALDALPRGPTGKLLRRKLRELHATLS